MLLTGLHSGHTPIRGNDELPERGDVWSFVRMAEDPRLAGQLPLPASTETLGRLLQSAGDTTAVVGKWGLGGPTSEGIPNEQGFDFFFGYNCQRQAHTYYPVHLWRNREKVPLANELVPPGTKLEDGANPTTRRATRSTAWRPTRPISCSTRFIERSKDRPFFLYYASPAPERLVDHYREKLGPEAPCVGDRGYFSEPYASRRLRRDDHVSGRAGGRAGAKSSTSWALERRPWSSSRATTAPRTRGAPTPRCSTAPGRSPVTTAGERGSSTRGHSRPDDRALARSHRSRLDERPPFRVLGRASDARRDRRGRGTGEHRRNELRAAAAGRAREPTHDYLYWEFSEYQGQQAVRWGRWKGIRKNIMEGNLAIELYDLERDREELHDVASLHPEVVSEIAEILRREHVPSSCAAFQFEQLGDK